MELWENLCGKFCKIPWVEHWKVRIFMNNLYRQGLSASMALQYVGDLEESKIKALQKKFAE